MIVNEVGA